MKNFGKIYFCNILKTIIKKYTIVPFIKYYCSVTKKNK